MSGLHAEGELTRLYGVVAQEAPRAKIDPAGYDFVLVGFSGGKDSIACVLKLLDLGVDPRRIELWHHEVDGREGQPLMDWRCTPDYCRKFAAALDLPIYFSWKQGGFEREMTRSNTATAPTIFETPTGVSAAGGKGPLGTRGMFHRGSHGAGAADGAVRPDVCAVEHADLGAPGRAGTDRGRWSRGNVNPSQRAYIDRMRSAGCCVLCGRPAVTATRCQICRDKANQKYRNNRPPGRLVICSSCGDSGHNARTCTDGSERQAPERQV